MNLPAKQELFSREFNALCYRILCDGWQIRHGHLFRDPEWAQELEERGLGIADSLHTLKLAGDLYLSFGHDRGGVSWDVEDYRPYGEQWKARTKFWRKRQVPVDFHWGGDFVRVDSFHFSIGHNGIR